ncbi:MAG: hypothetical protein ACK5MV_02735 [Aminipila sp.]
MANIFSFHGTDSKVGVTMISQSVAEIIAILNPDINVLFAIMNGKTNDQYMTGNNVNIDEYKLQMDSRIIISKDFKRDCKYKDNLYILGGAVNEQDERYYYPESAKYLLESVQSDFNVIITDTGNYLDNGLALGALTNSIKKYLVLTQYESSIERFEHMKKWYEKSSLEFDKYVLNRFREDDQYTIRYLSERLSIPYDDFFKINETIGERQAESLKKTFVELNNGLYSDQILDIANDILNSMGYCAIKKQRKGKKWRGFI